MLTCISIPQDFVAKCPGQLDTEITAQRDNFSLGQKQLFCIARATLSNSRVLVMDEATSAMDLGMCSLHIFLQRPNIC